MALREIIILPDKQLRLVSKPVEKVTPEIRKLADDMFETMYDAPGIGLAAIQVARAAARWSPWTSPRRSDEPSEPRVFINPEIVSRSDETSVYEEGCLSIPEYYEEVERPAQVRVRYHRSRRQGARGRRRRACSRPASSTRSTTSTACCSSTIISRLKRDRVIKKFKAAKRGEMRIRTPRPSRPATSPATQTGPRQSGHRRTNASHGDVPCRSA